jgi:hypothetical protein
MKIPEAMTKDRKRELKRIAKQKLHRADTFARIRRRFWRLERIYDAIAEFWEGVLTIVGSIFAFVGVFWLFSGCRASEHITNGVESIVDWFWK